MHWRQSSAVGSIRVLRHPEARASGALAPLASLEG
jgi:hypothetical protein